MHYINWGMALATVLLLVIIALLYRNILTRKRVEKALRESEHGFRGLMEQAPLGMEVFAMDGTLVQVNKAWEAMWGARGEEIIGKYNPLKNQQLKDMGIMPVLERAFAGEPVQVPDAEVDPSRSNLPGKKRWIRSHVYHIRDKDDHITNVVLLSEDISERKRAEQMLRALNQAALAIEHALTPDDIFTAAAEEMGRLGISCTVFLADESGSVLYPRYWNYEDSVVRAIEGLTGL